LDEGDDEVSGGAFDVQNYNCRVNQCKISFVIGSLVAPVSARLQRLLFPLCPPTGASLPHAHLQNSILIFAKKSVLVKLSLLKGTSDPSQMPTHNTCAS